MNDAQKQLLVRLREIVVETPKSGAVNAGGKRLYLNRFGPAVESRAEDGEALVAFVRAKVHGKPTEGYLALVRAGKEELTVEALVGDETAAWASEFADADREAARARLGAMHQAIREHDEAAEAEAVAYDDKIVENVSARRVASGKPPLTPEQVAHMLAGRAAERRSLEA